MTWLYAAFLYLVVVNAVASTAHIWVPVLLAVVGLVWGWRCRPSRRRRAADMSGQGPDAAPDKPDGESP